MRILVIGGTGHVGREVIHSLAGGKASVRAMVRKPEVAAMPAGVELIRGDLTAPESLDACLDGVDAVFLVWMAPVEAVGPAMERITQRARRIVYLSAPFKTDHPFFQKPQPNVVTAQHMKVEAAIERWGNEWTFLRPGMFAANSPGFWAEQMRAGDVVRWPYLDCETAPIDERDIAAVAVSALLENGHARKQYMVTGPESLTQREQVEIIGRALGRELRVEEVSPAEAGTVVLPGSPAALVDKLLAAWSGGLGIPAYMTRTVEDVTGRPPRKFAEWAADHRQDFL